jgi:hypothetical protein
MLLPVILRAVPYLRPLVVAVLGRDPPLRAMMRSPMTVTVLRAGTHSILTRLFFSF